MERVNIFSIVYVYLVCWWFNLYNWQFNDENRVFLQKLNSRWNTLFHHLSFPSTSYFLAIDDFKSGNLKVERLKCPMRSSGPGLGHVKSSGLEKCLDSCNARWHFGDVPRANQNNQSARHLDTIFQDKAWLSGAATPSLKSEIGVWRRHTEAWWVCWPVASLDQAFYWCELLTSWRNCSRWSR